MKKLLFISLTVILIASIFLVSCGKATPTPTPSPTPSKTITPSPTPSQTVTPSPTPTKTEPPKPTDARIANLGDIVKPEGGKDGGRLQLVGAGNIANLGDPNAISNPGDAGYAFPCIEPLLIIGKDGNLKPWLAEKFETAKDGSSMTLYLRQGVKFTDGTDFNANAAKYNLDNGINSTVWPNMKAVGSCDIINEYTVRLNFKNDKFDWGAAKSLAGFFSCCMFSPKSLKENTDDWKRTHVVGTGPFKLVDFERDQVLKYDRNDNYWRGKPYLQGIDYNIIPDPNTSLLAFKSGEVHTIGVQAKDAQDMIDSGFEIRESTDMVFNLCLIPSSNNPDSPLANLKVRQAVEYAIDKQALVEGLTYGYGHVSNQEFADFLATYDKTAKGYPFDLAKSKALLKEAGYETGLTTALWMADFVPMDLPLALQDMLSKANITLEIKKISIVQLSDMIALKGPGWEGYFYSFGFPGTIVDPASVLINGPLNGNTTWISCNEPQELLDLAAKGSGEIDPDKRAAIYREISGKMTDKYCMWTFMYWSPGLSSISPKVKGHTVGNYSDPFPWAFAWLVS